MHAPTPQTVSEFLHEFVQHFAALQGQFDGKPANKYENKLELDNASKVPPKQGAKVRGNGSDS